MFVVRGGRGGIMAAVMGIGRGGGVLPPLLLLGVSLCKIYTVYHFHAQHALLQ